MWVEEAGGMLEAEQPEVVTAVESSNGREFNSYSMEPSGQPTFGKSNRKYDTNKNHGGYCIAPPTCLVSAYYIHYS